ncbi:hypothetical protein [Spartinivicinus ruber]|uniref:hypothetical protein n=1 Tax=Spartinivicinus ruber TaxID=2683272 RepID=UPI0013D3B9D9|nr:hypothetical protein [Spartinivicinus ruber]
MAVSIMFILIGGLLCLVGWIWLIIIAFQNNKIVWGILILLFTLPGYLFGILNWNLAKTPFILLVVGTVLIIIAGPSELKKYSSQYELEGNIPIVTVISCPLSKRA